MNGTQRRKVLFYFVCIPVRTLWAGVTILLPLYSFTALKVFSLLNVLPISFWIYYTFVSKKKVGGFGGVVWWHEMRLIHAIIHTTFIILAFIHSHYAGVVLIADVNIGVLSSILWQPR